MICPPLWIASLSLPCCCMHAAHGSREGRTVAAAAIFAGVMLVVYVLVLAIALPLAWAANQQSHHDDMMGYNSYNNSPP